LSGNSSVVVKLSTTIRVSLGELAMMMLFILKLVALSGTKLIRLSLKVVVDSEICGILTSVSK